MNNNEIKATARQNTIDLLSAVFEEHAAVQFSDASFAILQEIDGQEVWVEINVKSKAFKPTKISAAFDPFEAAEAWQAEKKVKAATKAKKEAEKAEKLAKKAKKEEA